MARVSNKQILDEVVKAKAELVEVKALATTNALAVSGLRSEFQTAVGDVHEQLGTVSGQITELDKRLIRQETISNERKRSDGSVIPITNPANNSRLSDPKIFLAVMGVMQAAFVAITLALQMKGG
jgi:hypothetical protein